MLETSTSRPPADGRLTQANRARRHHAAQRYLTRLMAGEPALTDDQLATLRALLTPRGRA